MLPIKKACKNFTTLLLFGVVAGFLSTAPAWSYMAEFGTAVVDGEIKNGEYGDNCVGPDTTEGGDTIYTFTFCLTNDEDNIFFAFKVDDAVHGGPNGDNLFIFFDNNNDGIVAKAPNSYCPIGSPNEDAIGHLFGNFQDMVYCRDPNGGYQWPIPTDFITDGAGVRVTTSGVTVYEFSHPLNSGDSQDFSLSPGDTLGFCLLYVDGSNPKSDYFQAVGATYPKGGCSSTAFVVKEEYGGGTTPHYGKIKIMSQFLETAEKLRKLSRGIVDAQFPLRPFYSCLTCPTLLPYLEEVYTLVVQDMGGQKSAIQNMQEFIYRVQENRVELDASSGRGTASGWISEAENVIEDLRISQSSR